MINFLIIYLKKLKSFNLKVSSFGKHKNSDVRVKKIIKKGYKKRIFINFNNQLIDFEITDLNIHNVLAAIAVLKELKINFLK